MTAIEVFESSDESRYEIHVDGEYAGELDYKLRDGLRYLPHTGIEEKFAGHGLGRRLVEGALSMARESGEPIVPQCPFVVAYLHKHPEWQDIVEPGTLPPPQSQD